MKSLLVHDVTRVELPARKTVARFNVTIVNEDDEPIFTIMGWLYDAWRRLQPPRVKTGYNYISIVKLYPDFTKKLKAHLDDQPDVQAILGPERAKIPALDGTVYGRGDSTY